MRVKADDLVRKILISRGEDPTTLTDAEESGVATLRDKILQELEQRLADIILATPCDRLAGWRLLDDAGITETEDGSAMLPLPDDFLMLHSARLKGWERCVTGYVTADSPEALMQGSRWPGLRATAERPLAVMWPDGDGGRALRLYGAHTTPPALAEGWYMPAPRIDNDGTIEISNYELVISNY